jgi:hypothetical protein
MLFDRNRNEDLAMRRHRDVGMKDDKCHVFGGS